MKGSRVRGLMLLLGLLSALAATPLRLVEAAHDLAGTLSEAGGDRVIEPTDGGVGDDSDATINTKVVQIPGPVLIADFVPEPAFALPASWRVVHRRINHPPPTASSLPRRLAILQTFLC